jgi:lysophospholipase L1-like esterase
LPRLIRRHAPLAAAVAAALAAIALAACSPAAPEPGAAPYRGGDYVALGDSYTAGPDIPDPAGRPAGCERSSRSYPFLVARALDLRSGQLRDMSCGGATTADMTAAQRTGNGTNLAQLSALSAATTLVTIGLGGNDIGFEPVLTRCAELDILPVLISRGASALTPCQDYYAWSGGTGIEQRIQDAGRRMAAVLAEIRARAPHARVYVIGYPDLLPAAARPACSLSLATTAGDLALLNDQEQRLNATLRERAAARGASYVDTYAPSAGHDACAAAGTRWTEPLLPSSPAARMHPNANGERQLARVIVQAIRQDA